MTIALRAKQQIQLTPKQSNIYSWGWQHDARFRDAVCGRRFGKTYLAAKEMLRACKMAVKCGVSPNDEIWYAAPTFKQAKRVFWRVLKRSIPEYWIDGKPNESNCHINLISGHVIRIVGLDSYDNLRGSGLFFCIIDEWADCPYEAWEEVIRPMLSTCKYILNGEKRHGGHSLRIGTPKGFNHCYETYMLGQQGDDGHKSWLYTSLSGGNIPEEEIAAARKSLDSKTFRQEYMASFETYTGRIYDEYGQENWTDETIRPNEQLLWHHDFNFTPMSSGIAVRRGDDFYILDEIILTSAVASQSAMEFVDRYAAHGNKHVIIYGDPAGRAGEKHGHASDYTNMEAVLKSAGWTVTRKVKKAAPAIRDRQNAVRAKVLNADGLRSLFINPKKAKYADKGMMTTQVKEGSTFIEEVSDYQHITTAIGYMIDYECPVAKNSTRTTSLSV